MQKKTNFPTPSKLETFFLSPFFCLIFLSSLPWDLQAGRFMERKISYLKMYAGNGGSGGRVGKEGGKQPVANDLSVLLYQLWDTRSCLGEVRGNLGMWLSVAGIGRYRIPPDPLFSQVVYSEVLSPGINGRQRLAPRPCLDDNELLPGHGWSTTSCSPSNLSIVPSIRFES